MKHTAARAFTLIELLVVAAILMLISVVITQVVLSSVRSNTKSEAIREIKQNGDFAVDRLTRLIQNASAIDAVNCSVGGTTGTSLTITNADASVTTIQCADNVDGATRIVAVTGTRTDIVTAGKTTLVNGSRVTGCAASPLVFVCTLNGSVPGSVQFTFGLQQPNLSSSYLDQAYLKFSDTVVVRNQYAQ